MEKPWERHLYSSRQIYMLRRKIKSKPEKDDLYTWKKHGNWKERYSQLYSSRRRVSLPKKEEPSRISFMNMDDNTPYTSLLMRLHVDSTLHPKSSSDTVASLLSPRSDDNVSNQTSQRDDLGGNSTLLLDMVRARHRELSEEAQDKTLDLPKDETDEDEAVSEACVHGMSMRMTDRSVSRSRVSRMSTKRDMDIPSILAFTTNIPPPVHLEIPAFQKLNVSSEKEELPRWSIRRHVCPVCSQKWKDRSSIRNVKYSGLKRNSSVDLPTVIAPARLRSSITLSYVPRPALAAFDEDAGVSHSGLRNTSASWQLIRARRFRIPKPQIPLEATLPPSSTAPDARKDLDQRVIRFLKDEWIKPRLKPDGVPATILE